MEAKEVKEYLWMPKKSSYMNNPLQQKTKLLHCVQGLSHKIYEGRITLVRTGYRYLVVILNI